MPSTLPAPVMCSHRVSVKADEPGVLGYLLLCITTPLYVDRSLVSMHGCPVAAHAL